MLIPNKHTNCRFLNFYVSNADSSDFIKFHLEMNLFSLFKSHVLSIRQMETKCWENTDIASIIIVELLRFVEIETLEENPFRCANFINGNSITHLHMVRSPSVSIIPKKKRGRCLYMRCAMNPLGIQNGTDKDLKSSP